MNHETIQKTGVQLARDARWELEPIAGVIEAALTEANFHTLAQKISELIEIEKGRLL
jgi:hypothetical protein